ncbi:hypothetical protein EVAR_63480_1 [Eumeta japonica]|uniref:Uncharacterized protein n=1 Tax=Eumeta variegata TaxID=151549 RepID=A0A4C2A3V8_EUMVA|nr:hypothetical protein EVAR_63480_1 [Eumeta japonica]
MEPLSFRRVRSSVGPSVRPYVTGILFKNYETHIDKIYSIAAEKYVGEEIRIIRRDTRELVEVKANWLSLWLKVRFGRVILAVET